MHTTPRAGLTPETFACHHAGHNYFLGWATPIPGGDLRVSQARYSGLVLNEPPETLTTFTPSHGFQGEGF